MIEEDGGVRQVRMARVGDVVLLDHPADATGQRSTNCYPVKTLDFTAATTGDADAKNLKIDPGRLLYSLRWRRDAAPADLHLRLAKDPDLWLECIVNLLLEALARHDPGLRDRLQAAAAAWRPGSVFSALNASLVTLSGCRQRSFESPSQRPDRGVEPVRRAVRGAVPIAREAQ